MALVIAPLFTAGIAVGGIQNADAGVNSCLISGDTTLTLSVGEESDFIFKDIFCRDGDFNDLDINDVTLEGVVFCTQSVPESAITPSFDFLFILGHLAFWEETITLESDPGVESFGCFIEFKVDVVEGPDEFLLQFVSINLRIIEISIDIKPGSDPSCFNSDGKGSIPVAIFSTDEFDATQIDPATLDLDGQTVKMAGPNLLANLEDVDENGLLDLVVHFNDDGVYSQGTQTGTIGGALFDGTKILGTDEICITR